MKTLLIANTDWYLYNFRLSLAKDLRARGVEVVTVSPPGDYAPKLQAAGFRWVEWQVSRQGANPLVELRAARRLRAIYQAEQPHLVHHHTIKPALYGTWAASFHGGPAVVNSITGRGYVFLSEESKARLLRPAVKRLYRSVLRRPHCETIFENEADQQYFVQEGLIPSEHAWLVRSVGVDVQRFSPQPQPEGLPVVLFASRMLWDKGAGVFVEAARLLRGGVAARFALCGAPDAGNPASIPEETLRAWNDEGTVEWWGFRSDMPAVYASAAVFCLPTAYGEGVPTALIEAAASGRALVASDIPGCREVITHGENGLLVPPKDAAALAEAIRRLVEDAPLRQHLAEAARQTAVERFSAQQVNAETWGVYQQALGIDDSIK